jgi:hypothetical protein
MSVDPRELFRHVSAEKATLYRCILGAFATLAQLTEWGTLQSQPDEARRCWFLSQLRFRSSG